MDFGPGDIGPDDPYIYFLLENIDRTTQMGPSEGEVGRICFQNFKFSSKSQILKNVPLTISNSPKFTKFQIYWETIKIIFSGKTNYNPFASIPFGVPIAQ